MVKQWTSYEWGRRRPYFQKILEDDPRLRRWSGSNVVRAQNGNIVLKCNALNFEYNEEMDEAYVWRTGERYTGTRTSLSDLNYLYTTLKNWLKEQEDTPIPTYKPIIRSQAKNFKPVREPTRKPMEI